MKNQGLTRSQRGQNTRARILAVARRHFAAKGYERTTLRAIAAEAGIDPSLVMRYFTNKEGLFVAAAEFDLHLPDLRGQPRGEIAGTLVRHFVKTWEQDDSLRALLRTATTHARAAERMRAIATKQVIPSIAAACGDAQSAPLRACLISSQILGFAYARYVLKFPPLAKLSTDRIVALLGPVVRHYLFDELD